MKIALFSASENMEMLKDGKNITRETLESKIGFLLDCGGFSYAEIPKDYKCTMGVTGTLQTLTNAERSLLRKVYNINNYTYVPSVYENEKNKLSFSPESGKDCLIEDGTYYYTTLCNEIKRRLSSDGIEIDRAVLVFFETTPKLKQFYESDELRRADLPKVLTLIEETSDAEKESVIRSAVTTGTVTPQS